MKTMLILALAVCQSAGVMAQTPTYKMKVVLNDGRRMTALVSDVDSLTFVKLGKAEAKLSERYVTSTSLGVNIDIDANVSRVCAVCVPSDMKIDDVQAYVEKNKTVDARSSYKKSFDFLKPETQYTVYALAYDGNGLPSMTSQLTLTTGKAADDPFRVSTSVTTTTVDYTVSPATAGIRYQVMVTGRDRYERWCDEEDANGDVLQHFIAMWKTEASWYGSTWTSQMWDYDLQREATTTDLQGHLMWNADQVLLAFGMNQDGTLATPIQVEKVRTLAPTPSDNKINIAIKTCAFRDVTVEATTTNADTYFVSVQPESYVGQFIGTDGKIDEDALLVGLCYTADNINPRTLAQSGNYTWEFSPSKAGMDYYVIAVGLDNGAPSTKAVILPKFTLPAM